MKNNQTQRIVLWIALTAVLLLCACQDAVRDQLTADLQTGITDDEILIGSSLAMVGHAGYLSTQTLHGAMAYLRHINAAGGVNGRRIRVVAHDDGYDPVFYNVSFVGADALARLLSEKGEGVIVSQVVPPPETIGEDKPLWGAEEYAKLLGAYYPGDRPNFVGLEGYINARVLVEGLRRVGRQLDRESFVRAIESIRDFDLGIANPLSFSALDHQGLERVYFTKIERGRFVMLED